MTTKQIIDEVLERKEAELKGIQEKKLQTIEDLKVFKTQRVELKKELRDSVLAGKDSTEVRNKLKDNEEAELFTRQVEKEMMDVEQETNLKYDEELRGKRKDLEEIAIKGMLPTAKKIMKLKANLKKLKDDLEIQAREESNELKRCPDVSMSDTIALRNYFLSESSKRV